MNGNVKIVSRHPGAIRWLKSKFGNAEVIKHLDVADVTSADTVIGVLPLPMIKAILDKGAHFILLSLPKVAFSDRGSELTPGEMDDAGAKLSRVGSLQLVDL